MHEDDSSGNVFLGTENLCSMMVKDKSKILSILRNPGIICRLFLGPDDALPWIAAKECCEGLRDPEDMSCQVVCRQRHGILWIRQSRESIFYFFTELKDMHFLLILLCCHCQWSEYNKESILVFHMFWSTKQAER